MLALSDHRDASFGNAYGVLIVVDKGGRITYNELVKEVADEPDYEAALNAVKNLK